MLNLAQITDTPIQSQPYSWAAVRNLFLAEDAHALAATFPYDHFKTVVGYGGEKDYEYEARELIAMGAAVISHPTELSEAWLALAHDFLSPNYRDALSSLTGCDLTTAPLEVNIFHYGPGANLGPHNDLQDKLVTHVLYFNQEWNVDDGGCLAILRSKDPNDVEAIVAPIVGDSAVLVRSDDSWHAVSRVAPGCFLSRRSLTATFYRPGSVSTMWPPGDTTALHRYGEIQSSAPEASGAWAKLRKRLTGK